MLSQTATTTTASASTTSTNGHVWTRAPLALIALGTIGHGLMWLLLDQPWLLDREANERLLSTSYEQLLAAEANAHLDRYLTGLYRFFGWWLVSLGTMTAAVVFAGDFGRARLRRAVWLALAMTLAGLYALQWRYIPTSPFIYTSHAMTLGLLVSIVAWTLGHRRTYWDRQAQRYDRAVHLLNRGFDGVVATVASDSVGSDRMLEIAAGTGLMTATVAASAMHYTATDTSDAMLALLRQRTSMMPNVRVQKADAFELPFPDGAFDRVLIGNLLHLVAEPALVLAEASRVLVPGGVLMTPTFCHGSGWRARTVSRLLGISGLRPHHRFVGEDLDALVQGAGFHVTRTEWFPGPLPVRYVRATK